MNREINRLYDVLYHNKCVVILCRLHSIAMREFNEVVKFIVLHDGATIDLVGIFKQKISCLKC